VKQAGCRPLRQCVACRKRAEKGRLLRVVRRGGRIFLDPDHKMEGRGAYLCRDVICLETARKRGLLGISLGISIPADLYVELADAMGARPDRTVERMLGFCIKARKAVMGTQAVLEALKRQKIGIVFISKKTAPGTRSRLVFACRRHSVPMAAFPASTAEKSNVRVIGVLHGDFAAMLKGLS